MKNLQMVVIGILMLLIFVLFQKNQKEVIVQPQIQQVPVIIPQQYHNTNDFWIGYQDGRTGQYISGRSHEYLRGYDMGCYDRRNNCYNYYHRHCPPGFHFRIPGFHLNVR